MALIKISRETLGDPVLITSFSYLRRENHATIRLLFESGNFNIYSVEGENIPEGAVQADLIVREIFDGVHTVEII